MNMSIDEIKKVLKCCINDDCDNCPNTFGNCEHNAMSSAFDLICCLCETIEKSDYSSYVAQMAKQSWHAQNSEYINGLKAEINEKDIIIESAKMTNKILSEATEHFKSQFDIVFRQLETAKAEIERLQSKVNRLKRYDEERDIRLHARLIATAKSEAYKEFTERLLRKATIMRDEPQTNGVVRVGHIYETLEEMGCGDE